MSRLHSFSRNHRRSGRVIGKAQPHPLTCRKGNPLIRSLTIAAAALALMACAQEKPQPAAEAAAVATTAATPAVFTDEHGVAIHGYDPVSYFEGAPQAGDPQYFTDVDGARYLFASVTHKAKFDAAPASFAPQYGGYCAFGAAMGHKSPTQPDTGQIIDGKLYLNYNRDVKAMFDKDHAGLIGKADANWTTIRDDPPPN